MEVRQLKYFVAVASELSFTRAAARVGIAQPPLSQQIRRLERELGVDLFIRTKRQVRLTAAGHALVEHAKRILVNVEQAAELARSAHAGESGTLAIGAIYSSIYTFLPEALRLFTSKWPNVNVSLQEMTIKEQLLALAESRIDLGILRGAVVNPNLVCIALFSEPFVAAIPSDHRLAKKAVVSVAELASEPLVTISPLFNKEFSAVMEATFARQREQLHIVQEVADTHTLLGLVSAGMGVSIVPASFERIVVQHVAYRPLSASTPKTTLKLAWHKDALSPPLPEFIAAARAVTAHLRSRRWPSA